MTFRMPFAMTVFALLSLIAVTSRAQISVPGKPLSFYSGLMPQGRQRSVSAVHKLRRIDNAEERQRATAHQEQCPTCDSEFYGTGIDAIVDIKVAGEALTVNGGKLWRVVFDSETALGMQFYFSKYKLPKGGNLFIYNEDRTEVIGAFTHINNHRDEKFATRVVHGNKITLEYFEPNGAEFDGKLAIDKVIHVFKTTFRSGTQDEGGRTAAAGACTIDVTCPEGDGLRDERKAVCRISYYFPGENWAGRCSGFLVNNRQSIRKTYVLTADHCLDPIIDQNADPASRYYNWIFEFDYDRAYCGGMAEPLAVVSAVGAVVETRGYYHTDYALLDLQTNPLPYVNYMGWDIREGIQYQSTAVIGHPSGDVKKVALDDDSPLLSRMKLDGTYLVPDPTNPYQNYWRMLWDRGVTEGKSSGSLVLDRSSELAIGIFTNGRSGCGLPMNDPNYADYALRLSHAWDKSALPYIYPLGHYLDPAQNTKILASYIANPEPDSDPGSPGNGPGSPGKLYPGGGAKLTATYRLGDFEGIPNQEYICQGNYPWKVSHGWVYIDGKGLIEMVSENSPLERYTTGITSNLPFQMQKGKEYIFSMQAFDSKEAASTDYLEVVLVKNFPVYGCVINKYERPSALGQTILRLYEDKYAGGPYQTWQTFAIRFTPIDNYTGIYIRLVPKGKKDALTYWGPATVMIDRVAIHEKGDFYNPQVPDDLTVTSGTLPQKLMADRTLTVSGVTVDAVSNVQLVSHQVVLLPGFKVLSGATFVAKADDCIEGTAIDQPVGPLENNQVSGRLSETDEYSEWIQMVSGLENIHSYRPADPGVMNPLKETGIIISPNPASNSVTIGCERFQGGLLHVLDVNGKPVRSLLIDQPQMVLDVREFSKGLYFVEIAKDGTRHVGKLVVK